MQLCIPACASKVCFFRKATKMLTKFETYKRDKAVNTKWKRQGICVYVRGSGSAVHTRVVDGFVPNFMDFSISIDEQIVNEDARLMCTNRQTSHTAEQSNLWRKGFLLRSTLTLYRMRLSQIPSWCFVVWGLCEDYDFIVNNGNASVHTGPVGYPITYITSPKKNNEHLSIHKDWPNTRND